MQQMQGSKDVVGTENKHVEFLLQVYRGNAWNLASKLQLIFQSGEFNFIAIGICL